MKVTKAIQRLSEILPIKQTLDGLDTGHANMYLSVVNQFFIKGRAPYLSELNGNNSNESINLLASKDMLTLDEKGEIKGCYPFTMEQRVHQIQINGHTVHAMCALDALAPSAMFECPSIVLSECAVTQEPIKIVLDNQQVLNEETLQELHFGINWQAANSCSSCADSLCTEMLFLADNAVAKQWVNEDLEGREIFDLKEAIQFSTGFFKPMMQQG